MDDQEQGALLERELRVGRLQELLEGMGVTEERRTDLRWVKQNLGQYRFHAYYVEAMRLVDLLLPNGMMVPE